MLKNLNGNGRLWIYVAERSLSEAEQIDISGRLTRFCSEWQAHGNQLTAAFEMAYNQVILLAVNEEAAGATGCSIDKATAVFKSIDQLYELDLFNRLIVPVLSGETLKRYNVLEAKAAFVSGELTDDSIVLNTTISELKDLSNLKQSLSQSWVYPKLTKARATAKA